MEKYWKNDYIWSYCLLYDSTLFFIVSILLQASTCQQHECLMIQTIGCVFKMGEKNGELKSIFSFMGVLVEISAGLQYEHVLRQQHKGELLQSV